MNIIFIARKHFEDIRECARLIQKIISTMPIDKARVDSVVSRQGWDYAEIHQRWRISFARKNAPFYEQVSLLDVYVFLTLK
jgi:hypothetical protein